MTSATFSTSIEAQQAAALIDGYRFELGSYNARQWVTLWLELYRPMWIRDAVVEALYQGRYKSRSVKQILELWERRGQPIRHATHEFEAAVCREFGEIKLVTTLPQSTVELFEASQRETERDTQRTRRKLSYQNPARERASRRIHQSLSAIAFNSSPSTRLSSELSPEPLLKSAADSGTSSATGSINHQQGSVSDPTETANVLRSHKQQNGIPFSSGRAIQPFKPTLPFSNKSLRLAQKQALAAL